MDYKPTPTVVPAAPFDASADAQALRAAMKGFGTDEEEVINLLTARSNAQRQQIKAQFETEFGRDLVDDLKSELGGKFEDVIVALMTPPVEYLCKQLHEAMAGMGTDEETLVEILCTKTNEEMQEIVAAYEAKYDRPLAEQMCSETSGHFRRLLTLIVTGVRDPVGTVDAGKAHEDAEALYAAGEEKLGTDEEVFNRIMSHSSFAQLRLIFDEYKELSGQTIEQAIKHEMDGALHDAMIAIVECVQSPAAFFANRLYKAMNGAGTNDAALIRLIVSRSEIDLGTIKDEFERIYDRTLYSAIVVSELDVTNIAPFYVSSFRRYHKVDSKIYILAETSGDYKNALAALLGGA